MSLLGCALAASVGRAHARAAELKDGARSPAGRRFAPGPSACAQLGSSCGGARLGGLWARGERSPTEEHVRAPWPALSAGFGAALDRRANGAVELYAGMSASLARSRLELCASELNVGPRLRF